VEVSGLNKPKYRSTSITSPYNIVTRCITRLGGCQHAASFKKKNAALFSVGGFLRLCPGSSTVYALHIDPYLAAIFLYYIGCVHQYSVLKYILFMSGAKILNECRTCQKTFDGISSSHRLPPPTMPHFRSANTSLFQH
jgi:hypothetical protein